MSQHLKSWWKSHEHETETITTKDGRTIDFSKKSLARVALKTAITPIVAPCMTMLYATKGTKPRDKVKHEDVLDYAIDCLFDFIAVLDTGELYVETVERDQSNDRHIQSISTNAPTTPIGEGRTDGDGEPQSTTEPTERTRGETLVHRRENGYGQNGAYKGSHSEET